MTTLQYANNEELVLQYQNGNDYAFTELFENNQGLIRELINKYKHIQAISEDVKLSACYRGFMSASKAYKPNMNMKFSSLCMKAMERKIFDELNFIQRKDRLTMIKNSESMNTMVENRDGQETEALWFIDVKESDEYFKEDEMSLIDKAINHAMSQTDVEFKDYIIPIVHGEVTKSDVGRQFNVSKQVVAYHVKRFLKHMKNYLVKNKVDSVEGICI